MVLLRHIIVLSVLQRSSVGLTTIDLHFTSNNCDEEPRRISENKVYNLTWEGQISPKLCHFQFTGGETGNPNKYEVCFESATFDLPYSFYGVELRIKNFTGTAWKFDYIDNSVPRTCVARAYKMNVSIQVPPRYVEPQPATYIQMQITAVIIPEPDIYIIQIIGGVFAAIIFFLCVFCNGCKNNNSSVGRCVRGTLDCFADMLSSCLKCECLQCLSGGNSQRNVIARQRGEPHEIALDSGQALVSPPAACSGNEMPPSYNAVSDMEMTKKPYIEPAVPPPSYEDATGQTLPSAPPSSNYY